VFLVYTPEGQPEQRFHYKPGRLRVSEMAAIEKASGMQYGATFKQELMQGATIARQVLLWTFLRRQHPTLKLLDVDFFDDELKLIQDKDEIREELEALEKMDSTQSEGRVIAMAMLQAQLVDAPDAPGKGPAPAAPDPVSTPPTTALLLPAPAAEPTTHPYPEASPL
jgi:hypothetical protein